MRIVESVKRRMSSSDSFGGSVAIERTGIVRVVVIEDNPSDVRLIRELLSEAEDASFEVCQADRLDAGIQLLRKEAPDAVILDLGLPDSSGLAPVVAVHESAPELPIIVLTGSHDRTLAVETIRAGAHYCLVKDEVYGGGALSRALRYAIERRQLAEELDRRTRQERASEARLQTILEHEPDGVVVLDGDGIVLYANPAAVVLLHPEGGRLVGAPFSLPVLANESLELSIDAGGLSATVDVRLVETDWEGRPAYVASLRDVTERRRLEAELRRHAEELEEKNNELDAFSYSISHDLKEPVRSVTMFSGFLLEDYAGRLDEEGIDYLKRIGNAGAMMGQMIEDLLALAQVGRQTGPRVRLDVRRIIEEVEERLQGRIEAKGAVVRIVSDLPEVRADAAAVGQVFANLISNGLKFNENAQPVVEVGCGAVETGMAAFYVRDNGIGIAPEFHDKVFGLFQRLNSREKFEGTGAGLAIVKRVVEVYGGSISVDSAPGAGTTFSFTLPAWNDGSAAEERGGSR